MLGLVLASWGTLCSNLCILHEQAMPLLLLAYHQLQKSCEPANPWSSISIISYIQRYSTWPFNSKDYGDFKI